MEVLCYNHPMPMNPPMTNHVQPQKMAVQSLMSLLLMSVAFPATFLKESTTACAAPTTKQSLPLVDLLVKSKPDKEGYVTMEVKHPDGYIKATLRDKGAERYSGITLSKWDGSDANGAPFDLITRFRSSKQIEIHIETKMRTRLQFAGDGKIVDKRGKREFRLPHEFPPGSYQFVIVIEPSTQK